MLRKARDWPRRCNETSLQDLYSYVNPSRYGQKQYQAQSAQRTTSTACGVPSPASGWSHPIQAKSRFSRGRIEERGCDAVPAVRNEILKCADHVAASGAGWSVLPTHLRPPSSMSSPIQKVLCGSIDRDVPAERVQTLLELGRLVEDLDDLELPAVVQCALAQEARTLVGCFRTLRLIRVGRYRRCAHQAAAPAQPSPRTPRSDPAGHARARS